MGVGQHCDMGMGEFVIVHVRVRGCHLWCIKVLEVSIIEIGVGINLAKRFYFGHPVSREMPMTAVTGYVICTHSCSGWVINAYTYTHSQNTHTHTHTHTQNTASEH